MIENCIKEVLGIPFKSFKEKKRIIRSLELRGYRIQVIESLIYAEK